MKKIVLLFSIVLSILLTGTILDGKSTGDDYDVLIKDGKVFDGSKKPAFKADVAIKDGMIVKLSETINGNAAREIDANGLFITPGFIDLHTHVDRGMYFPENRACLNYLKQGVTTIVVGQCGSSAWPIFEKAEDQMNRWTEEGIGPNAALLVGHGTVREIVMGDEDREPTPQELDEMKALVKEAVEQGAHGLSTGLIYRPGSYANTDELIELVKIIGSYGGIYHSHIRNENVRLLEAVQELIRIAEATRVPAHISHFKVMGKSNWGSVKEACQLIEDAQKNGLAITADQYPYRFSSNNPYRSLVPQSAWTGEENHNRLKREDVVTVFDYLRDAELIDLYSKVTPYIPISEHHQQFLDALPRKRLVKYVAQTVFDFGDLRGPENARERMLFLERWHDPEKKETIKDTVKERIESLSGAENIVIGVCVNKEWEGKTLQQIANWEEKPIEEMAVELELMGAKAVPLQMCEEDIEYIMKKDYVGTGSDGVAPFYGIGFPHIRSYSTFLHKIKKYGLNRNTASLSHIIRSQTSLPAKIMDWEKRGQIKKSYKADITVLDLNNITINTSISNPHQYCEGVKYLLVNGKLVIENGEWNGKLPGEVIKP